MGIGSVALDREVVPKAQKFSLQPIRGGNEGGDRPDRDAQFGPINQSVTAALAAHDPVISVDTKKNKRGAARGLRWEHRQSSPRKRR